MSGYFARLNPSERRFIVAVGLVLFVVVNLFWVWPHFSDWGKLQKRLMTARGKLAGYQAVIQEAKRSQTELTRLENEGASVAMEDQAIDFMRTIQMQAQQSGISITSYGHQNLQTNEFFNEQSQTISTLSEEKQLVDFLHKLGSGNSLIRVRALSVRPDQPRQRLSANITLVASYQKNRKSAPATTAVNPAPKPKAATAPKPGTTGRPQPPRPASAKPPTPKNK